MVFLRRLHCFGFFPTFTSSYVCSTGDKLQAVCQRNVGSVLQGVRSERGRQAGSHPAHPAHPAHPPLQLTRLSLLFCQECLFIRRQEENNPDCVPQSETSVVAEGPSLPPDHPPHRERLHLQGILRIPVWGWGRRNSAVFKDGCSLSSVVGGELVSW